MRCFKSPITVLNSFYTSNLLLFSLILVSNYQVLSQNITTYAGGLTGLGTALNTNLASPTGLAMDAEGNIYVSDLGNNRIRKIDPIRGTIQTVAGNGNFGFSGDGGSALSASLGFPGGVALDAQGNLYIADQSNNRIRKVDALTGIITTIAGTGDFGFQGDGGPANQANLANPVAVLVDAQGNILVSDLLNNRIRKIDAQTGIITTIAGNGDANYSGDGGNALNASLSSPFGLALDTQGNLYIADQNNNRIRKVNTQTGIISTVVGNGNFGFAPDGTPALLTPVNFPGSVRVDSDGNIFFTDLNSHQVRKVDHLGIVHTVAGNGFQDFSGDGALAIQASLSNPADIFLDNSNNLFITDASNNRLRKVEASTGIIQTIGGNGSFIFGGDGDPAISATLRLPAGLDFDSANNLFIADTENNLIRRVDASTKIITSIAGTGVFGYNGDGIPALQAQIGQPVDVAIDANKNIFILERGNNRVRRIDAVSGIISTAVGTGATGFAGDGRSATEAFLNRPAALVIDRLGNMYIADELNNRVRKVDAITGFISTLAGNGTFGTSGDGGQANRAALSTPKGLALDTDEKNLYIATSNLIRKVDLNTGIISTVAGNGSFGSSGDGGLATEAALKNPVDLLIDQAGNLYIAEFAKIRIVLASTGIIQTILGNGDPAYSGDNGPALAAQIGSRVSLLLDKNENLYISDTENNRVRRIGGSNEPLIEVSLNDKIFVEQDLLDFGLVKPGQQKTFEIKIQNIGSANLELVQDQGLNNFIEIIDDFSDNFSLDLSNTNTNLNPGEFTSFLVIFLPKSSGSSMAKLKIRSNAENQALFNLNLAGSGISALKITGLMLVDATRREDIMPIKEGSTINLSALDAKLLTIRAITEPARVGSVFFDLQGPITQTKLENLRPYSLFGENLDHSFVGKIFTAGDYFIECIPYPLPDQNGVEGEKLTIHFALEGITQPEIQEVFLIDADADTIIQALTPGAVINLDELGFEQINILTTTDPSIIGSVKMTLTGTLNHVQIEEIQPYALFGDRPGGDFKEQTLCDGFYTLSIIPFLGEKAQGISGKEVLINFQVIRSPKPEAINLVDVSVNEVLFALNGDDTIDLAQTGINLTIRAEIPCVESVRFILKNQNGQTIHTRLENLRPFNLFGDNKGFPNAWQPQPGDYILEVLYYRDKNAVGLLGNLGYTFTVLNSASPGSSVDISLNNLYPNPLTDPVINLEFSRPLSQDVELELRDYRGKLQYATILSVKGQKVLQWMPNQKSWSPGVYYLRVTTPGMLPVNQIILVK
ncbi:MAG: hypothetical protein NW226_24715 [Microscillaceae bacterium]|nr:hypothetical protein [Microscillaceae bacterium]